MKKGDFLHGSLLDSISAHVNKPCTHQNLNEWYNFNQTANTTDTETDENYVFISDLFSLLKAIH